MYVCDRVLDIGLVSGGSVTAVIPLLGPPRPPSATFSLPPQGKKTAAGEEEDEIVEGKKVRDQFFGSGGITAEGERRGQPLHKAV